MASIAPRSSWSGARRTCFRANRAGNGSTGSRLATSCASRSPSALCRTRAAGSPRTEAERSATATGCGAVRESLLLLILLSACAKGPEADLQYIKQARSLAAEWALVNEQAAEGRLTAAYESLTRPDARYAFEIDALLKQPDDAPPEELRAHAEKLKQIEDGLES